MWPGVLRKVFPTLFNDLNPSSLQKVKSRCGIIPSRQRWKRVRNGSWFGLAGRCLPTPPTRCGSWRQVILPCTTCHGTRSSRCARPGAGHKRLQIQRTGPLFRRRRWRRHRFPRRMDLPGACRRFWDAQHARGALPKPYEVLRSRRRAVGFQKGDFRGGWAHGRSWDRIRQAQVLPVGELGNCGPA